MKISALTLVFVFCIAVIQAQNVGINESGAAPAVSAILDVAATNKGLLMPRLANHATVPAPATGLIVYNTTTNTFWYFNGTIWVEIRTGAAELVDLDGDTRVTVEWNPDEDIIRFFAASAVDQMRFNGKTLHFTSNNTFIGNSAGDPNTGAHNTFLGYQTGLNSTSGSHNTLLGSRAGEGLLNAQFNVFIGSGAGMSATTTDGNTFIGYFSGNANVSGVGNTFTGFGTGYLATGSDNAFYGYRAGSATTTAEQNVFVGKESGFNSTTGGTNVFVGYESGFSNTTGTQNVFIGWRAGRSGTGTTNNTVVGYESGRNFTTGLENSFFGSLAGNQTTTGRYNTFIGNNAGRDNLSANANTFIGWRAGFLNTTGNQNTFLGYSAGRGTGIGNENVFLGHSAGDICANGNRNVFVGKGSGQSIGSGSDNVFLGYQSAMNAVNINGSVVIGHRVAESFALSNRLYIGNGSLASETLIYGEFANVRVGIGTIAPTATLQLGVSGDGRTGLAEAWNVFSDARYKTDLISLTNALSMVRNINGYYYKYINDKSEKQQVGVIAQELELVLPQLVFTDEEGYKSVDYSKLTPVLIEAIKEQQAIIESLEKRLERIENILSPEQFNNEIPATEVVSKNK
jgi:trimeric autotransporter adhesin